MNYILWIALCTTLGALMGYQGFDAPAPGAAIGLMVGIFGMIMVIADDERFRAETGVPPAPRLAEPIGDVVVTWAGDEIVMVSRQNEDHQVIKVIAMKGNPPNPQWYDQEALIPARKEAVSRG